MSQGEDPDGLPGIAARDREPHSLAFDPTGEPDRVTVRPPALACRSAVFFDVSAGKVEAAPPVKDYFAGDGAVGAVVLDGGAARRDLKADMFAAPDVHK